MGRTATVTQQESNWAIEQLLEKGEVPTWQRVRESVGDRGSPVVLSGHIKTWFQENGRYVSEKIERVKIIKEEAASAAALPDSIIAQMKSANAAATKQLEAAHAERVAELEGLERGLQAQQEALLDRERALDDRQMAQAEFVADLKLELAAAKEARGQAESALIEVRSHLAVAGEQITQLQEQLVDREQRMKKAEQATIEQIRDNATLTAQVSSTEQQVRKLESEAAAALANVQSLQAALAKAQDQAAQAVAAHQARDAELSVQIGRLTEQLAETQAIMRGKDLELKALTVESSRLQITLAARDAALETAQQLHAEAGVNFKALLDLGARQMAAGQSHAQEMGVRLDGNTAKMGELLGALQQLLKLRTDKP